MSRILFILYFFLHQAILIAQNISNEEKKADIYLKTRDFKKAIDIYSLAIKWPKLNYIDSLRIKIKQSEAFHIICDKEKLKQSIDIINDIARKHSDIEKNAHWASYLEFTRSKYYELIQDYPNSRKLIDNAIKIRMVSNKDSLLAIMFCLRAQDFYNNYNSSKSIFFYNKAMKYFIINKIYDNNIIRILLNKAFIYWQQNDLKKFKHVNEIAIKMSKLFIIDDGYIAQTYMNLGTYYLNQSDYFNAYKCYFKAEQLTNIDSHTKLQSEYYMAYTSYLLGDMNLSSSYFKKMKSNFNLLDGNMQTDLNYYYSHTFLTACNLDSTIYYLDKCLISNKFSPTIKQEHILYAKAYSYTRLNKKDSALKYISLAINKVENRNSSEYAKSVYLKGKILSNSESEKLYHEARYLILKNCGVKHSKTAYLFKEIGLTQFENKKYRQALQNLQQALISVDLDFNSTNIFENPKCEHILSSVNLAKTLRYKSEALEQIYLQNDSIQYLESAYETSKLLTEQIEKMLMSYPLFESKQFVMDNSANTFSRTQYLGYLCWKKTGKEKYKNENILLAEKSRAAILKSQIQDNELNGNNLNDSSSNKLIEIEQNIAYITGQINESSASKTVIDELKSQLFELQEQKNKITESLKGEYGNFSNYFKNIPAMSYQEIMNFPSENEAILEYTLCDSIIILNVISKNKHEILEIPYDSTLQNYLQRFKNIVIPKNIAYLTLTTQEEINDIGGYLYNALLKPTENIIKDKQLLIVQEPKLGFIPFGAFVKENKYLIEFHPIN